MTDRSLVGTSANYDWGVYNAIYNTRTNTTDPAGTWRTPTNAEWVYVMIQRTTCSGVRFARATVNGVVGLIIVPDNWDVNTYALNNTNNTNAEYTGNTITSTQWNDIFEPVGCVFLPAASNRDSNYQFWQIGTFGNYWSSTHYDSRNAYYPYFSSETTVANASEHRCDGRSVRLVKDLN